MRGTDQSHQVVMVDLAHSRVPPQVGGMDRKAFVILLVFAGACAERTPVSLTPSMSVMPIAVHAREIDPLDNGDAARGRQAFIDLRCHVCHRVAGDETLPRFEGAEDGPVLHDLGRESAEAVAWRITARTSLDPESIYDSPMEESASAMTGRQLADVVAYLRNPAPK